MYIRIYILSYRFVIVIAYSKLLLYFQMFLGVLPLFYLFLLERGNRSRNNTSKRSFQRIREEVHSHFLIKGNYYNGEREVEETKILIDTGASCNHIQADKCEIIGNITSLYVYKNYDGQTLQCNLQVEIPIRLQGVTFIVDCYKDNLMQGNGHYDILLRKSFLDILDKYKITKEGI